MSSSQKRISKSTDFPKIKWKVKSAFDCSGERFRIISNVTCRRNKIFCLRFFPVLEYQANGKFFQDKSFCNVGSQVDNVQVDHLQQSWVPRLCQERARRCLDVSTKETLPRRGSWSWQHHNHRCLVCSNCWLQEIYLISLKRSTIKMPFFAEL